MESDGQLYDAEPGAQMTAGLGDGVDGFLPKFIRKLRKLFRCERAQVAGQPDAVEQGGGGF
jgi:hypothetical protein